MIRFWIVLFLLSSAAPAWTRESQSRNVIIVDICSARADHFGMYGYSRPTTPGMDALAKESVVFDRAMAQSSWCLPNYATLFTGHTPEVHGQYVNLPFKPLPDFEIPLSQRMKEAGYKTAAFTGGIYFLKPWGLDKGFDTFVNLFSTSAAMPASMGETLPLMTQWIEKNKKAPFFLYAAVDDLHAPFQSDDPERYDQGYEGVVHDTDTLNVQFFRAYNEEPLDPSSTLKRKLDIFRRDPRHLAHVVAHYDASLNQVDDKISEFVRYLKEKGLWDKSVVIITADHGELLGEHGLLGHTEGLYEPILRVPMILHHPDYPGLAGKRVGELVQRTDIAPTVLDVGRAPYALEDFQGKSLIPLLEEPARPFRTYAYASSKRNMAQISDLAIDERVMRTKKWKLHWYLPKGRFELYDLENDPLETRDLSARRPDVVSRLSFELLKAVELSRPHAPGLPGDRRPPSAAAAFEKADR